MFQVHSHLFWWCMQFLASSSSDLWLLIPAPTASFQLCQRKHLCGHAGNQTGELIQLKITLFFPSQFSGRAVPDVAGWWKAGGQQDQDVRLGGQDAPWHLVMLAQADLDIRYKFSRISCLTIQLAIYCTGLSSNKWLEKEQNMRCRCP